MLTMKFTIYAIQLKNQRPFSLPDCYHFSVQVCFYWLDWSSQGNVSSVQITFDNNARTGKIRQHLNCEAQFRTCNPQIIDHSTGWTLVRRDLLIIYDFFCGVCNDCFFWTLSSIVLAWTQIMSGSSIILFVRTNSGKVH